MYKNLISNCIFEKGKGDYVPDNLTFHMSWHLTNICPFKEETSQTEKARRLNSDSSFSRFNSLVGCASAIKNT